jgi:hypothetical protein
LQFYHYFYEQNQKIANGGDGIHLDFDTLGIINGIIDEGIQVIMMLRSMPWSFSG